MALIRQHRATTTNAQDKKELEQVSAAKQTLLSDIEALKKQKADVEKEVSSLITLERQYQGSVHSLHKDIETLEWDRHVSVEQTKALLENHHEHIKKSEFNRDEYLESTLKIIKQKDEIQALADKHIKDTKQLEKDLRALEVSFSKKSKEYAALCKKHGDTLASHDALLTEISTSEKELEDIHLEIKQSATTISRLKHEREVAEQRKTLSSQELFAIEKELNEAKKTLKTTEVLIKNKEKELDDREAEIADIALRKRKNDTIAKELEAVARKLGRNVKLT